MKCMTQYIHLYVTLPAFRDESSPHILNQPKHPYKMIMTIVATGHSSSSIIIKIIRIVWIMYFELIFINYTVFTDIYLKFNK